MSKRKNLSKQTTVETVTAYAARLGMLRDMRARLQVKSGPDAGKDIAPMLGESKGGENNKFAFTQSTSDAFDHLGIDPAPVFDPARNPKAAKRIVQLVNAMVAGDYSRIDTTTAVIMYALQTVGESSLTTDALHYLAAGLKAGKVSPETRGVNRSNLTRLFGRVGLSTVATQASRTVGARGFLQLIGATKGEPGKTNQSVTLNHAHPLVVEFMHMMNEATQGQIDALGTDGARNAS